MRRLMAFGLLAIALPVAACNASSAGSQPATAIVHTLPPGQATPTARPLPTPPPAGGCQPASAALMSMIESGLTVSGGGSLGPGQTVKSGDFNKVWFVSAVIKGPGMGDDVGTWATNDLNGNGFIYSAEAFAREFSSWGPGPGFNLSDDGLEESQNCVH